MSCSFWFFPMEQAECDELAQRADSLKEENASLRAEMARIKSEYDQLVAQNASLKVLLIFELLVHLSFSWYVLALMKHRAGRMLYYVFGFS